MKTRDLTDFKPTGDVIEVQGLDPKMLGFSKWFFSFEPMVIFLLALIIIDFETALALAGLMAVLSTLGYLFHLHQSKKFLFRIWSDGLEFFSPGLNAFIPYSEIVWIGRTPKPFAYREEIGFEVDSVILMTTKAVLVSPTAKTSAVAYRTKVNGK